MTHHNEQHPERCPNCASDDSTIPIVTINGTTLWTCANDSCSAVRWRTDASHEGLGENPDPATVERILNGAAAYRNEQSLEALADDIARLYRNPRTENGRRKATPCPR